MSPAVLVNVQRQPGANVIQVVNNVQALLPELRASLPSNVNLSVVTDRTNTIRASVNDVQFELTLAVALVVMVIFLFLRSVPATIIPSLSVPVSLIGTFAVMYLAGFSLDNLSLMALTIASGFVVDDAIVMIENISRHIEKGEKPLAAALKGSGEIAFTIVSLTISLIAVLIPLLFMREVVGRLFREFAITLAISILISAVVSLTLVPMLCAKMLRTRRGDRALEGKVARKAEEWFNRLIHGYGRWLERDIESTRPLVLWIAAGTLVLTVLLYVVIPKGFFPLQDTGLLQATTVAPPAISFAEMTRRQQALAEVIRKDPDVESLTSYVGVDGTNATLNNGRMLINLKSKEDRSDSIDDGHAAPAAGGVAGPGHHARPAAGAGPDHQLHPGQRAVPVHPGSRQPRHPRSLGAEAARGARSRAGAGPRVEHVPRQGPDGAGRHRPQHRCAFRHNRCDHRQCAL